MRWNHRNGPAEDRSRQTLIGIFPSYAEASRALVALHEHAFVAEHDTLAEGASEPDAKATSAATRSAGNWFGELRQIYHEDTSASRLESSDAAARLARYDVSPDQARTLARDFGPDASIVAVEPTDRWEEAQSLLKKYGARILSEDLVEDTETPGRREVARDVPIAAATPSVLPPTEVAPLTGRVDEIAPARSGTATPIYDQTRPAEVRPEFTARTSPPPVVDSAPFEPPASPEPGHIQLFGEELRVHKEKINNADVRVRKETVTRMETVQVPVTREHLVVEHTDGSPLGREGEIRIPLSEERVRIEKEMRLHEEYKAGKRQVTENESVTEPLRKERLLIDQPNDEPQK